MARKPSIKAAAVARPTVSAIGGGLEGAEATSRQTATWMVPTGRSPDAIINLAKPTADARGQDMVLNDGYALGGMALHKDSIVGSEYRLNAQPNHRVLKTITNGAYDEVWAEEFQLAVEGWFNLLANSPAAWLDASRRNTFTGLVRLAVGGFVYTGEVLAASEWVKEPARPLNTAVQMVSPDRLSNPNGQIESRNLRRGVVLDDRGRPTGYWIRMGYPSETLYDPKAFEWKMVPAELRWGRLQIIHIIEQVMPAQTRGIADMVAALKQMRITKQFQEVTLQQAVVNASFAAAVESELPGEAVAQMIGSVPSEDSSNAYAAAIGQYLTGLAAYTNSARNIQIDGVKIPHLYPGTKLNLRTLGTPGGVGTDFEKSLLRHIAAALGVSYEEFARDYSNTSYSSARTSMTNTWKFMQTRKTQVADRFATAVYTLALEEMLNKGAFPLPRGRTSADFYLPLGKEAFSLCGWIGASRGQIDELKETQAAILRIAAGLSTYEKECARLGDDFRDTFAQRQREQKMMETMGLTVDLNATRSLGADQNQGQDQQQDQQQ